MGSSPFDRLYSGNRCYFLLLRVLRCFSSPRSLRAIRAVTGSLPPGCPIRISAAVAGICPLPRLFAAYHVLRRLREPRHPPCALVYSVYLRYALRSYRRRVPFCFAFARYRIQLHPEGCGCLRRSLFSRFVSFLSPPSRQCLPRRGCGTRDSSLVIVLVSVVENNGFEPLTPCVQSRCSSQLS